MFIIDIILNRIFHYLLDRIHVPRIFITKTRTLFDNLFLVFFLKNVLAPLPITLPPKHRMCIIQWLRLALSWEEACLFPCCLQPWTFELFVYKFHVMSCYFIIDREKYIYIYINVLMY